MVAAAAIDLARYIRAGDTVVWGQACAEPLSLTARLTEQHPEIGPLRCFLGVTLGDVPLAASPAPVSFAAYGGGGGNRALVRQGRLEILPCHYSELPRVIASGALRVDVLLVQVTPGEPSDTYHFALAAEYLVAAAAAARVIIAEVNAGAPRSPDAPVLRAADITAVVSADYPPAEHVPSTAGSTDQRIAAHVAGLVPDRATLQTGLGSLPDAILAGLADRRDLGVHSGTIGDGVVDLIESGVITNEAKSVDRGITVTGMLMGTARLFRHADDNPAMALRGTEYTHDPDVLAALPRFVAVNSAVEVDLTGQVNSEVAAGRYVGAVGGALDFIRGAQRSRGGLPVIALPSTAGSGSRIVAELSGPVTIPRADVGIIVTEHGVADLRGLSLSARRRRMLAIADPAHQAALEAAPPTAGQDVRYGKE